MTTSVNEKKIKIRSKGPHVTHFLEFCDPPNISAMNEARNFKFGSEMDDSEY